mmetsp:Transcript_8594/g.23090  ORF Transcript_8594/g.23090 Transcript_8594/m.23090 type:complete len:207 (-) Transcript_8594:4708-5328(-)
MSVAWSPPSMTPWNTDSIAPLRAASSDERLPKDTLRATASMAPTTTSTEMKYRMSAIPSIRVPAIKLRRGWKLAWTNRRTSKSTMAAAKTRVYPVLIVAMSSSILNIRAARLRPAVSSSPIFHRPGWPGARMINEGACARSGRLSEGTRSELLMPVEVPLLFASSWASPDSCTERVSMKGRAGAPRASYTGILRSVGASSGWRENA